MQAINAAAVEGFSLLILVTGNTIVIYTTDNGNELLFWPDGGYAPFRGEKGTTWEGGLRVPCLIRWPGVIPPGTDANGIQSHEDLFVTLAAAAGLPHVKEDLLKGYKMGDMTYKVHRDGYNNLDYWILGAKQWATTASGPFLAAHLKSLQDYPPRQGQTLSG